MGLATCLVLFAVLSCSVSIVSSEDLKPWNSTKERDEAVYKKYLELDEGIKVAVHEVVKKAMQYMMQINEHVDLSRNCKQNVIRLLSDTRKLKISALRIIDASAKISSGLLVGNLYQLGDYDECMTTSIFKKNGSVDFKGKYCVLNANPALPSIEPEVSPLGGHKGLLSATRNTSEVMKFLTSYVHYMYYYKLKLGICIPSGCSSEDVDSLLNYVTGDTLLKVNVAYCDEEYDNPASTGKIAAICFLLLFAFLNLVGSVTDYYFMKKGSSPKCYPIMFIRCFSVLTNFPKLINLKNNDKSISCIQGIRSFSMFYIVFLHQHFFISESSIVGHLTNLEKLLTDVQEQIVVNGYLATEIFFFISGFLNSYVNNERAKKFKSGMNGFLVILRRLYRIYPTYAFGVLSIYLASNSHGPRRTFVNQRFVEKCDKFWWRNMLFINNLFEGQEMCLIHSWYLSADMHAFLISLITLPVLLRSPKKGIIINVAVLIIGLVASVLWSWHKEMIPTISSTDPDKLFRYWNGYVSTFFHIAPYFTGLLIGYFLSAYKEFKISLIHQLIGWPLAGITFATMLFLPNRWTSGTAYPSLLESIFYLSFSKFLYTAAVAWVIVCCTRGYGGIINYFLSLKVWVLIGRISFMMYMIAPNIQMFYIANTSLPIDSSVIVRIWQHFGDLGISILLALAMTTIVESPFIAMEKLILNRKTSNENTENNNESPYSNNEDKSHFKVEQENNKKNSELNTTPL